MVWVNEYRQCIICGKVFRSGGVRVYCSSDGCLEEYKKRILIELEKGGMLNF